jgi:hypothetical protein
MNIIGDEKNKLRVEILTDATSGDIRIESLDEAV